MRSSPDQPAEPAPQKAHRNWPRIVFAIGFGAFAIFAIVLAPVWLPLTHDDDGMISFERAQRRWRTTWGLALPAQPDLAHFSERLTADGLTEGAPVLIRIFKRDFELELWMKRDGVFHRFAAYPICRWSGALGPKLVQGDRQAPEGFYTVDANALNPNSRWHRSFNLGYPNAFDRAHARTGSLIMVHGGCASVGCFAMTNPQIDEIWRLVTAALGQGQKRFQVQVYPFRLTDENLAKYAGHAALPFWKSLKLGNDLFEASLVPPEVSICNGAYEFEPGRVYQDGDGVIENRCPSSQPKS